MADVRITDLPLYSDLDPNDVFVIVDVSNDMSVKIPLNKIIPEGGAADQFLAKKSAADYDFEWQTRDPPRFAHFVQEFVNDTPGPIFYAGVLNQIVINVEKYNTIAGAYLDNITGIFTLPDGVYKIEFVGSVYVGDETRVFLQDEDTDTTLYGGPNTYGYYNSSTGNRPATNPELKYMLQVTGGPKQYSIRVRNSLTSREFRVGPGPEPENYGELMIQKIS